MTTVQTAPVAGVLLADVGSSSVENSGKVYLLVDKNDDGDFADLNERIIFFDFENASGITSPSENVFTITQASDRSVYIGDGDTDTVYRLFDNNGDGDANDNGEATVWLSPDNAAGVSTVTPNGIAEGPDGAVYIVNAGVSSAPQDAIYRTQDLNGDGDANDEGETTVWVDLQNVVASSSPFDISFIGDTAYLIDPAGSAEDAIYAFEDKNKDNIISDDEITTFATASETSAVLGFTQTADGDSILVWEDLDFATGVYSLFRLTDLDGSGQIDQPDETVEVWNTTELPGIFDTFVGFSVASDQKGRVALTSNGDPIEDNVYLLEDLNGDGDFFDDGESNVVISGAINPEILRPRAVEFYDGPVQTSNASVGGGNQFSLFLDREANTLFASGDNALNQLAQGVAGFDILEPIAITLPDGFDETIVSVSAGQIHGAFITDDGDLYTWGFGLFGRLGLGDEESRAVATKVDSLDDQSIVVIEMGNGASYAIAADGTLYAWGQNSSGQLGLGDEEERLIPTPVDALAHKTVVAVAASVSHTLALTSDGEVWAWGSNIDGQVGDPTQVDEEGDPVREILNPVRVEGLPNDIVGVSAETQTSYAITSDGRVFGWGETTFGQLFLGVDNKDGTFVPSDDDKVLSPIELTALPNGVIDVTGGARWGAALTEDGDVYLWGPNDEGPSGILDGDTTLESDVSFFPVKLAALDDVTIVEIEAGPNHLIAVDDGGIIYTLGLNGDGRLGLDSDGETVTEPTVIPLDGDAAPYLLSASPADNERDVPADAALVLTYTEVVEIGVGSIRIVNRDDPKDIQVINVDNRFLIDVDSNVVTVTPFRPLQPDARYAIEIDDGAFVDLGGKGAPGIDAGDTSTFNFTTADTPVGEVILDGTDADELLIGGDLDDVISGAAGDDTLLGNNGDDNLAGGDDDDLLRGGRADDTLTGDIGDDTLRGNGGDDVLEGGAGRDVYRGGNGADTFIIANDGDRDVIVGDFTGKDRISLDVTGIEDFDDVLALAAEMNGSTRINFNADDRLILSGTSLSDLDASDFIFV
ncbi:MAG: Ig-like domain-containing protein [Pseudomonadota bacterium]